MYTDFYLKSKYVKDLDRTYPYATRALHGGLNHCFLRPLVPMLPL